MSIWLSKWKVSHSSDHADARHQSAHVPLRAQLLLECEAMTRYVLQHGVAVEPDLIARLLDLVEPLVETGKHAHQLAVIHRKLAQAIAPATPQAIVLLDRDRVNTQGYSWLGPVPLIRILTLTAIGFLLGVILIGTSAEVSFENVSRGMLESSGMTLLANIMFLMFCAGLGASFAALFQAHHYIANVSYDPKYDASYGARIILGVIAGLILVEILPAKLFEQDSLRSFGKPALAMLSGFSSTAVHRLLQRLVDTLETLVRGDGKQQIQASIETLRAHATTERAQAQSELAAQLVHLQQSLDAGSGLDAVRAQICMLTRKLLDSQATELPLSAENGATCKSE